MRTSVVMVLVVAAGSASAQSFEAASEFSLGGNPTGVWSYGFRGAAADAALTLFSTAHAGSLAVWDRGLSFPNNYPRVVSNTSAEPIFWGTDIALQPGELGYHPGPSGEFCVVRFTAPSAGDWTYATRSVLLDGLSDGVSVHVVVNGVSLFTTTIGGGKAGGDASDARQVTLAAGDTIDFVCGSSGNNTGDTLQLVANVRAVPAPGGLALLGGAALLSRRRRG